MTVHVRSQAVGTGLLRDLIILTKPEIVSMTTFTSLAGIGLAPGSVPANLAAWSILGTSLSVASANVLNMYWERDLDKLMARTRGRPLPAGRMDPWVALVFGIFLGLASIVILLVKTNPLTAFLAALGIAIYVLAYTPLKRITPHALLVGSIAGALPPLMGWTSVTGGISFGGMVLAGILLIWQVPHFLAIALYRKEDYARARIQAAPLVWGERVAKRHVVAWSLALLPISLLLFAARVSGWLYACYALALGLWWLTKSIPGFRSESSSRWAYQLFRASLVYLLALAFGMLVDAFVFRVVWI